MVPVVLLAAGLPVVGCGSQQAYPLSVAKTEQVFAAAGIHLRSPLGVGHSLVTPGAKEGGHHPAAVLIGGSGSPKRPSFVFVFRTVADAVHARRLQFNPRIPVTRVQNVVIVPTSGGQLDPRLRAAIRHL